MQIKLMLIKNVHRLEKSITLYVVKVQRNQVKRIQDFISLLLIEYCAAYHPVSDECCGAQFLIIKSYMTAREITQPKRYYHQLLCKEVHDHITSLNF